MLQKDPTALAAERELLLHEFREVARACLRDDPQAEGGPSPEQLMANMEEEKVNRRAQIYLRDLRRDAVIEYN